MANNERYGLSKMEIKVSPAFASMLLAALDEYDWREYEEETGEFDETLLEDLTEELYPLSLEAKEEEDC